MNILIIGATGNIGTEVIGALQEAQHTHKIVAGVRDVLKAKLRLKEHSDLEFVRFDFEHPDTFRSALEGIDRLFLLRPPHISDIEKYFSTLISTCKYCSVKEIVFLSVQGAEKSKVIPHNKIEKLITENELDFVFLRPGYFMQNLTTTLLPDILKERKIILPSGKGKFNWIDIKNIAEVAAEVLIHFDKYRNQPIVLTGYENRNFYEVAEMMNREIESPVTYESVNPFRFYRIKKRDGMNSGMIMVMIMLHSLPRIQKPPAISKSFEKITGRSPNRLADFIRRERSRFIIALILLAASPGCTLQKSGPADQKPNIVLINIDDMGWKDVGFMGSEYYETPNIDGLAARGMVFTNGYAAAANCAPSRACMMTGKWTPRHGIYTVGNSDRGESKYRKLIPTENTTTLADSFDIIPKILLQNGYATCHAGKWHLSKDPLEYGFQVNIGGSHAGHPRSYNPPYKNVEIPEGKNQYLTDLVMEKAVGFLDTVRQPFFLYYSPYAVHTPIQQVDSLMHKYVDKPAFQGQNNPKYATMVENLDRNIGWLISTLQEKGVMNHTLIVFTSDNGGLYGITQQKPLRAGKGSYYEGGIREPFAFAWEGEIEPGTSSDVPITNMDIFPTLLSAAGIDVAKFDYDGESLLPLLRGNAQQPDRKLFWHFPIYLQAYNVHDNENRDSLFRTRPGSVVRYGDWKLHYYFEDDGIELYNLATDRGEQHNLSEENPEKREEMLSYLRSWWEQTGAPIPSELNPEYRETTY